LEKVLTEKMLLRAHEIDALEQRKRGETQDMISEDVYMH